MGIKTLSTEYKCDRCGHVHVQDERAEPPAEKWGQVQHGCVWMLLCPACERGLAVWLQWVPKDQKPTEGGKLLS